MKITFYGTHSYDRHCFSDINKDFGFELNYHRSFLEKRNADLTAGAKAVCIFVNDRADREELTILKNQGVEKAQKCSAGHTADSALHGFLRA